MVCPNKNNPDWVKLEAKLGEVNAIKEYMLNGMEIPNPDLYEQDPAFAVSEFIKDTKNTIEVQNRNLSALESGKKTISLRRKEDHSFKEGDLVKVKVNKVDTGITVKVDSVTTIDDFTKLPLNKKDDFAKAIGNYKDFRDLQASNEYAKPDSKLSLQYPETYKFLSGQIGSDIIKYTVVKKEKPIESPFLKQQLFFTRRIARLERLLETSSEGTPAYIKAKEELKAIKTKAESAVEKQDEDLFRELGDHTLDKAEGYIEELEVGSGKLTEEKLLYAVDTIKTWKDFPELETRAAALGRRLLPFINKVTLEEINKYATEGFEITQDMVDNQNVDVSTFTLGVGSLSDLANYIGRTIGSIIRAAQNKVETTNKKLYRTIKEEVDLLEKYAKERNLKLEDVYDLFIQESTGTTVLTKRFDEEGIENDNYKRIMSEPALERFYNFYKDTLVELEKDLPIKVGKYFIPNIRKSSTINSLKALNPVQEIRKGITKNEELLADIVSVQYTKPMDSAEKSRDLAASLLQFGMMANNQKEMSSILPKVRLLQEQLTFKTNALGQVVPRSFIKTSNPNKQILGEESNIYKMADAVINMQVKGNMKKEEGKVKVKDITDEEGNIIGTQIVDTTKVADNLLKYNSLLRIGLSPMTSIANVLFGDIANIIESVGGRFFSLGNLNRATKIFFKQNFDKNSALNTLLEELNPLQELDDYENIEKVGVGSKMSLEKLREYMYMPQKVGEKFLQSRTMLAMMLKQGYIDKDGNLTGKWQIATENEKRQLSDQIQRVNQLIHGRYTQKEAATWQQSVVYRLASQFRKWIPSAIEARIGTKQYDNRLQVEIEGRYNTFAKLLLNLKDTQERLKSGQLTELEIYNMKKNLIEITLLAASTLLFFALKGLGDDDDLDKNPWYKTSMTLLNRVSGDLLFFYDPKSGIELTKTAIPLSKTVGDIYTAVTYIPYAAYVGNWQYKTGSRKGDNKFYSVVSRLTPGLRPIQDVRRLLNDYSLEELR